MKKNIKGNFCSKKNFFKFYPEARYAEDVIFQRSNRPIGNNCEIKKYFSGKNHLYGFKTEVSVVFIRITIGWSPTYAGSEANISIFRKHLNWHRFHTKKDDENETFDNGEFCDDFPNNCAILAHKGYFGAQSNIWLIIPNEKPINGILLVAGKKIRYFARWCHCESSFWSSLHIWNIFSKMKMGRGEIPRVFSNWHCADKCQYFIQSSSRKWSEIIHCGP